MRPARAQLALRRRDGRARRDLDAGRAAAPIAGDRRGRRRQRRPQRPRARLDAGAQAALRGRRPGPVLARPADRGLRPAARRGRPGARPGTAARAGPSGPLLPVDFRRCRSPSCAAPGAAAGADRVESPGDRVRLRRRPAPGRRHRRDHVLALPPGPRLGAGHAGRRRRREVEALSPRRRCSRTRCRRWSRSRPSTAATSTSSLPARSRRGAGGSTIRRLPMRRWSERRLPVRVVVLHHAEAARRARARPGGCPVKVPKRLAVAVARPRGLDSSLLRSASARELEPWPPSNSIASRPSKSRRPGLARLAVDPDRALGALRRVVDARDQVPGDLAAVGGRADTGRPVPDRVVRVIAAGLVLDPARLAADPPLADPHVARRRRPGACGSRRSRRPRRSGRPPRPSGPRRRAGRRGPARRSSRFGAASIRTRVPPSSGAQSIRPGVLARRRARSRPRRGRAAGRSSACARAARRARGPRSPRRSGRPARPGPAPRRASARRRRRPGSASACASCRCGAAAPCRAAAAGRGGRRPGLARAARRRVTRSCRSGRRS